MRSAHRTEITPITRTRARAAGSVPVCTARSMICNACTPYMRLISAMSTRRSSNRPAAVQNHSRRPPPGCRCAPPAPVRTGWLEVLAAAGHHAIGRAVDAGLVVRDAPGAALHVLLHQSMAPCSKYPLGRAIGSANDPGQHPAARASQTTAQSGAAAIPGCGPSSSAMSADPCAWTPWRHPIPAQWPGTAFRASALARSWPPYPMSATRRAGLRLERQVASACNCRRQWAWIS